MRSVENAESLSNFCVAICDCKYQAKAKSGEGQITRKYNSVSLRIARSEVYVHYRHRLADASFGGGFVFKYIVGKDVADDEIRDVT